MSRGKNGQDVIIKVPVGTLVREVETGKIVADMNKPNRERIVLHGGIKNFLHGVIEPMNFVDKEYIAFV